MPRSAAQAAAFLADREAQATTSALGAAAIAGSTMSAMPAVPITPQRTTVAAAGGAAAAAAA